MTGYHAKFPTGTAERMRTLLKTEQNTSNYKRIQCIYLRAAYNYPAEQIADIVGFRPQVVRDVHSGFIKHGEVGIFVKGKGGRMVANMPTSEEEAFLRSFEKEGALGQVLEINSIHQALMTKLQRNIPKSSVYNLLHRHGWRKIAPRPYHPKSKAGAKEAFKKTFLQWSKMQEI